MQLSGAELKLLFGAITSLGTFLSLKEVFTFIRWNSTRRANKMAEISNEPQKGKAICDEMKHEHQAIDTNFKLLNTNMKNEFDNANKTQEIQTKILVGVEKSLLKIATILETRG